MFKTDLEIAQECKMEHIRDIAAKIGVGEEDLEYYGYGCPGIKTLLGR